MNKIIYTQLRDKIINYYQGCAESIFYGRMRRFLLTEGIIKKKFL